MEPRISIITLGVADLERSTRFYRDGLGLPHDPEYQGIAFFPLQGTWLALYPRGELAADANVDPAGSGFAGVTLAHNMRSRAEVDQLLEQAGAAGAKVVKPAEEAFWGGYSGDFADPDGHLWEVAWNPNFPLD
jgi:catechol 2,3-dioxygenase-like lactoylglutathione lyase family enzyme